MDFVICTFLWPVTKLEHACCRLGVARSGREPLWCPLELYLTNGQKEDENWWRFKPVHLAMVSILTPAPDCDQFTLIVNNCTGSTSTILKVEPKIPLTCNWSFAIWKWNFPICFRYHNENLLFTISPLVMLLLLPPRSMTKSFGITTATCKFLSQLKKRVWYERQRDRIFHTTSILYVESTHLAHCATRCKTSESRSCTHLVDRPTQLIPIQET